MKQRSLIDQMFQPAMAIGACFVLPLIAPGGGIGLLLAGLCLAAPILWLLASLRG